MNLKDAIASGKPIKYKTHTWYWRPGEIPAYLIKAADDNWEVVEEVPEYQLNVEQQLIKEAKRKCSCDILGDYGHTAGCSNAGSKGNF